eukprot:1190934-Prorocentrum_minimum.AAC.2
MPAPARVCVPRSLHGPHMHGAEAGAANGRLGQRLRGCVPPPHSPALAPARARHRHHSLDKQTHRWIIKFSPINSHSILPHKTEKP